MRDKTKDELKNKDGLKHKYFFLKIFCEETPSKFLGVRLLVIQFNTHKAIYYSITNFKYRLVNKSTIELVVLG